MYRHAAQPRHILLVLLTLYTNLLYAVRIGTPNLAGRLAYKSGDKIPISCLNRTMFVPTLSSLLSPLSPPPNPNPDAPPSP